MARKPNTVKASVWLGRIEAAKEVWRRRQGIVTFLKDAVAGRFPPLVAGTAWPREGGKDAYDTIEQINVNLVGRATTHYKAVVTAGGFPTLRFPNVGEGDEKTAPTIGQLIERALSSAEVMPEIRSATGNVCTSGSWVVWYGIDQEIVDQGRIDGAMTPIGDLIAKAVQGLPVSPLPGMDYVALARTARDVMMQPDQVVALDSAQRANLTRLAQEADKMADDEAKEPKSTLTLRGRIWTQHSPYGPRGTLWDPTVWDIRHIGWAARYIVMSREQVEDFPLFTAKARKELKASPYRESDGHARVVSSRMDPTDMEQENGAIGVWEIHDKVNRKRHFVCDGYDDYLEVTDEHPMLDSNGEPLLPNFFPFVVRTPLVSDEMRPERTLGLGLVEAGWPHQVEVIKFHSAHATAAKKTARIMTIPSGLDDDTKADLALARDCAMIPIDEATGQKAASFGPIDFGPAPVDYLASELRATANFAKAVGISLATLTGEPVADTLGQEELAMEGSNVTSKYVVSELASGVGELAIGCLALIKRFYPDEMIASLVGKEFVEPQRDAMGNPIGPSPWSEWKKTSLYGDRIECVFSSQARADELAKRKQKMDFVVALEQQRDLNGLPKYQTEPYWQDIAKDLGMGKLAKYEPTPEEKAMIALTIQSGMAANQQMQRNNERPNPQGGGDPTSRIAGGGRGVPPIPNQQSRGRAPQTNAHLQGVVARPATAT